MSTSKSSAAGMVSRRVSTNTSRFKGATSIRNWTTPLWLQKLDHLVGRAALSLVSQYIFSQPTIVLVWVFIALNFVHVR